VRKFRDERALSGASRERNDPTPRLPRTQESRRDCPLISNGLMGWQSWFPELHCGGTCLPGSCGLF